MKKYRVIVDMRYAEEPNTGLTRFTVNIFKNLIKNSSKNYFYYLLLPPKECSKHFIDDFPSDLKNFKKIFWRQKRGFQWKLPFVLFDLDIFLLVKEIKPDLFISPYIDPPFLPFIKVIATIHDLIFIEVKDYFQHLSLLKRLVAYFRILITILICDNLLVVSSATKKKLINRFNWIPNCFKSKIKNASIISNGIELVSLDEKKYVEVKELINKDFFLYVGDRRPHKNIIYLIKLVKALNKKFSKNTILILAGSNKYKNLKLNKFISNNALVHEILNPSDLTLDFLYRNCKSFFLISKEEGFGIPVIEAASRGAKIVISNIPALREISPKYSCIINLREITEDVNKISCYLKNDLRPNSEEVIKKWSWQKSSKNLFELIKIVLES